MSVPIAEDEGSSWESDWESDKNENNEKNEAGFSSDSSLSSDGNSDKCPICLFSFTEQEIGVPDVCEHEFCGLCIEEWSKTVTTCPIDRKIFEKIKIFKTFEKREFLRDIVIQQKKSTTATTNNAEEDLTYCEVCNSSDREDCMLLCDGCDGGYHMFCLIPPLENIPSGSWYCDNCFSSESEASEEDINNLIEETEELPTRFRERIAHPRMVRTRQSERIRATIVQQRNQQIGNSNVTNTALLSASRPRIQRKVRRKTKLRRKRKQKRKTKSSSLKRRLRTLEKPKTNPTKKIRDQLNNNMQSVNYQYSELQRHRVSTGIPILNITTPANDLDEYMSDVDEESGIHGFGGEFSGGLLMRHNYSHRNNLIKRKFMLNEAPSTSSAGGALDLLNNILQDQERWHSKDGVKNMIVEKNGTIRFNKLNETCKNKSNTLTAATNGQASKNETSSSNNAKNEVSSSNINNSELTSSQNNNANNIDQSNATNLTTGSQNNVISDNNLDTISSNSSNSCNSILNKINTDEEKKDKPKEEHSEHSLSDDDDDTCPNFSVYSLETMELAKISEQSDQTEPQSITDSSSKKDSILDEPKLDAHIDEEHDVDLVQLGDDDDDYLLNQIDIISKSPIEDVNTNSDKMQSIEIGTEMISDDDENIFDEIQRQTEELDKTENSKKKDNSKTNDSKSKSNTFKKISKKLKERNYRDKDKSDNINTTSRSDKHRYYDTYSSKEMKRNKRNDIERYDVKMVIAEKRRRTHKDQFGRDRKSGSRSPSSSGISSTELSFKRKPHSTRSASPVEKRLQRSRTPESTIRKYPSRSRTRSRSYDKSKKSVRINRRRSSSRGSHSRRRKKRSRSRSVTPDAQKNTKSYHYSDRQLTVTKQRGVSSTTGNIKRDTTGIRSKKKQKQTVNFSNANMPERLSKKSKNKNPDEGANIEIIDIDDLRSPHTPSPIPNVKRMVNIETAITKPTNSKNLTVILTNEDNEYARRTKKKEKKSRNEKKQRSKRDRNEEEHDTQPTSSKEVFTSGDNILISLNFGNKEKNSAQLQSLRESKKKKSQMEYNSKSQKKKPSRQHDKNNIMQKKKSSDMIIDLNPSPLEIILDSDEEDDDILEITESTPNANFSKQKQMLPDSNKQVPTVSSQQKSHIPPAQSSNRSNEKIFEDTPIPQISQKNKEAASHQSLQAAYDPFEPTKSPSSSPEIHRNTHLFAEQLRGSENNDASNKVNANEDFAKENNEQKKDLDKQFKSPLNNNDGGNNLFNEIKATEEKVNKNSRL